MRKPPISVPFRVYNMVRGGRMPQGMVSIILPAYNRAALLPRAIHSVMRQLYPLWELILIDDGSTDATVQTAAACAGADSRITYIRQENAGPAVARNTGIRAASGEFIAFLDSDDEYLPHHLSSRVLYMNEHLSVGFLHGGVQVLGGIDRQFVPDRANPGRLIPLSECVIGGTFFARKGIIEQAGGWQTGFAEDADLFDRLASVCPVAYIPVESYLYHRDTPGGRCDDAMDTPPTR